MFFSLTLDPITFFLVTELFISVFSDPCFDVFSTVQDGMYMEHHSYSKVTTYSLYACAAECLMSSVCLSFSYHKHRHVCHLNDNTVVTDIVLRQDFIYSDIRRWPKLLSGPCSVRSCPASSRCEVDQLHRATCAPEFQGCGKPLNELGSVREYEGRFLGAIATYICRSDFKKCHNKTTSVCQSTGQWEDLAGLCGQFRWHNPDPKDKHYTPCGTRDKFDVTVVGTPTKAGRMKVMDQRNIAVMNSWISGVWGREEWMSTFPLAVDREFHLKVNLQGEVYLLAVDGADVHRFQERSAGVIPNTLVIYGDVSVHLVEF